MNFTFKFVPIQKKKKLMNDVCQYYNSLNIKSKI